MEANFGSVPHGAIYCGDNILGGSVMNVDRSLGPPKRNFGIILARNCTFRLGI
jgi:hypothetical protein